MELASNSVTNRKCHVKLDQKYEEVNEATFLWFNEMREKHGDIPLVESVIREKAIKFARELGLYEFKASNGWFRSWKMRCHLESYKVTSLIIMRFLIVHVDAGGKYRCSTK